MTEQQWIEYGEKHLLGRKITYVSYLNKVDAEARDWFRRPIILQLDDGTFIYPSSDDEGNDGGTLFGQLKNGEDLTFPVL